MPDPVPISRASIFQGLSEFLAAAPRNLDLARLLQEVGLDPALAGPAGPDLNTEKVPLGKVSRLFEIAARRANAPCLGLDYSAVYKIGASGSLGFVLAHSPSMRVAIENLVAFVHAFISPIHIEFRSLDDGDGAIEWVFPLEGQSVMPQYVSFALGAVIRRLRVVAGPAWTPKRVTLVHRALPCPEVYETVFGRNVRFGASENLMVIKAAHLDITASAAEVHLYRTALKAVHVEVGELRLATDIRQRVRGLIEARLSVATTDAGGKVPELADIASELDMEPRRLQTVLEKAGSSYTYELNETRKLAAERLLIHTDKSMTEIAHDLGFSELSSFTRVSKGQWFAMSPSHYRTRKRNELAGITSPPDPDEGDDWTERD